MLLVHINFGMRSKNVIDTARDSAATNMITTKRKPNGDYWLFKDSVKVGYVFKCRGRGFGLSLDGIYWRGEAPSRKGGCTSKRFLRLRDARAAAEIVLERIAP
jgi:hypothetical protein